MSHPGTTGLGDLPDYAVIAPVKNEIDHLARTLESVVQQTHRPVTWIVVDDGSDDGSAELAEGYAERHPWIHVVRRPPGQKRARGGAVVAAFEAGLEALRALGPLPEVIVKLDGDLYLPPHYFAWVCATFAHDERAGLVGGRLLVPSASGWEYDAVNPTNVHGAFKAYRTACYEEMGGLPQSMGWDGIDHYAARARGWNVHVLSELTALHYTPRGSKQKWARARWDEGRGMYWMGYILPMAALRTGYRMLVERPPILGGLVLGASYVWHTLRRAPQAPDAAARAELRAEQRQEVNALLRGRSRHAAALEAAPPGPAYWATGAAGDVVAPVEADRRTA